MKGKNFYRFCRGMSLGCVLLWTLWGITACTKAEKNTESTGKMEARAVQYRDGTYKVKSGITDDWGGYAEITLTVQAGTISSCEFLSYEKDGTLKDENYGKQDGVIKNTGLYKIAQNAIKNAALYGERLVETQDPQKVDAITGATVSHKLFQDAAARALEKARTEH